MTSPKSRAIELISTLTFPELLPEVGYPMNVMWYGGINSSEESRWGMRALPGLTDPNQEVLLCDRAPLNGSNG